MNNIEQWFKNHYTTNCYLTEVDDFEGELYINVDDIISFMIVAPHSGTNNQYMLRVSTLSAFDRWANSTAIEKFFNTEFELIDYLNEHQLDIYKELLSYLSEEYNELDAVMNS
jgi:hypothetical protein